MLEQLRVAHVERIVALEELSPAVTLALTLALALIFTLTLTSPKP